MQMQCYDNFPAPLIREIRAAYYGLVTQIDYNIGRILSALCDTGAIHDTYLVFTADHGEFLCDHRGGAKGFFHEASAHVPMIVVPPLGERSARIGTSSDQLVCLADLLPTLVGLGGGKAEGLDGVDFLVAEEKRAEPHTYIEGSAHNFPDEPSWYWAITDGRWKYIWYPEGSVEQLFDVLTDPQETSNLAARPEHAPEKSRLLAEMIRRHEARGSRAVQDGRMASQPLVTEGDSERERRARMWAGLHTEYIKHDVQH